MAVARYAEVLESERVNEQTVRLTCRMPADDPLEFIGGQYLIVDTGQKLPNGKAAKRAYSMLSSDGETERFSLAVYHVENGPGSTYMHELKPGDRLQFSGPWGKKFHAEAAAAGPVWVITTDTGITAGLGLVRSERSQGWRKTCRLTWLTASEAYFLTRSEVERALPQEGPGLAVELLPAIGDPQRPEAALAWLERELAAQQPGTVYLVGDGDVLYPMQERLEQSGLTEPQLPLETYFNHRAKKSV